MRSFGLKRVLCAAVIALGLGVFATCGSTSAVSGTVTLEGQKVVTGGSVSAGEFSFELRKPNSDEVIMTTTNDDEGNIVFENVKNSKENSERKYLRNIYKGKSLIANYPRNYIFYDAEAGVEMKKKLGFEGKKIYAYMPTWRDAANDMQKAASIKKTEALAVICCKCFCVCIDHNSTFTNGKI